ncbi:MAG TPA: GrpB family protein [Candidatus Dormibacteraeota bacterium]|nr:GrpB family protein [Candidatus Dormibacteraeota bacterium]
MREERGDEVDVIALYELVAASRGLPRPEDLPVEERLELAWRALRAIDPTFELREESGREPEPISLVPYDPAWPALFERWRHKLLAALPGAPRSVEHVGSTAVPGLAAKPVIDIQVGVEDLEDESSYAPAIEALGVQLRSRDREHRYFRPFAGLAREVHVHVCQAGGEWERRHLVFRDYLRADADARRRYAEAKEAAVSRWSDDRIAYTHAKGAAIRELTAEAERWSAGRT